MRVDYLKLRKMAHTIFTAVAITAASDVPSRGPKKSPRYIIHRTDYIFVPVL